RGPEPPFAPLAEPSPHVVGVDFEGIADVLEREEPGAVGRIHPLPGLLEDLRPARVAGMGILLVAVDRVLEDGEHQQPLALETAGTAKRRKVLSWEKNVGCEQACQPIVSARKAPFTPGQHQPLLHMGGPTFWW